MRNNPKILIVDDEPFNVDYLEQELDESHYETISAVNGQDALDKVNSDAPDLVLLDIMMPGIDGFEVLARIKANPVTRDIPVIIISASSDMKSVVKGIQLGAEDYLPKPFDTTLLHARISSSLEKKRLRDLEQIYLKGMERELDIGREIQMGFLPTELPKAKGWEVAAYFKAAHEVAGDFYDAFLLPDGNLVFVVGDVCGKGVGAALFMTLFRSLIRAAFSSDSFSGREIQKMLTPGERLHHAISFTNGYIADIHGDANMFATIFIAMVNLRDGKLAYINCGNEPPLLVKKGGEMKSLPPTGPSVGVIQDARFSVREIPMDKEDLLVAFTDGIPDTLNSDNEPFGNERLLTLVKSNKATPAEMLHQIEGQLQHFIGKAEQFDDITIMAVKRV